VAYLLGSFLPHAVSEIIPLSLKLSATVCENWGVEVTCSPGLCHCLLERWRFLQTCRFFALFIYLLLPQSEYVQYIEGFLAPPGYIDLSKLRFATLAEGVFITDDVEFDEGEDEDGDGHSLRKYDRALEGDVEFILDIAVFQVVRTLAAFETLTTMMLASVNTFLYVL